MRELCNIAFIQPFLCDIHPKMKNGYIALNSLTAGIISQRGMINNMNHDMSNMIPLSNLIGIFKNI